jgi:Tfp pilus assembly protein PilV
MLRSRQQVHPIVPPPLPHRSLGAGGFTIVEVMMASVILVVGFVGMIEAVTISAKLMDAARRQTLATQIINHEIEKLRFAPWVTTNSITGISNLPTASTAVAIDTAFWPAWNSATPYVANRVVSYNGAFYRCVSAHTGQTPPNATYWTATTAAATSDIIFTQGATYTLARTVTSPNPVTDIREVNFTLTWVVNTSRVDAGGTPLTFTFTRANSAWFGKYGLNLSYQRS